jgi:NAD(P)-dependent dehydrogenase (short-subunit alcohol dehydrogenase family)
MENRDTQTSPRDTGSGEQLRLDAVLQHMHSDQVLVTGGSGFLGAHFIVALLNAGYRVRTTVRALSRGSEVRDTVTAGGADAGDRLAFSSLI